MSIGFDFFLFIAFFIPGVFILYALSLVLSPFKSLVSIGNTGKETSNWLLVLSLCILLGMMSSILRSSFIDPTFRINLSNCWLFKGKTDWAGAQRVEPDYSKLSKDDLEALKELKNEEKRPYQFYGNMLIALTCLLGCLLILCFKKNTRVAWRQFVVIFVAYLFSFWILYIGSRFSHFNYMHRVEDLNTRIKGS
jgi:hypothetical protein